MEPEEFRRIQALAAKHWWYQSLIHITRTVGRNLPAKARILDAGCGTGFLQLAFPATRYFGCDLSPIPRSMWTQPHAWCTADIASMPWADATFDLTICLDVLYHQGVQNHRAALSELRRVTRRGGHLLLQAPAFEFLRNHHDRVVHTKRRYTKTEIDTLVQDAGFEITRLSYRNSFAFFPIYLSRFWATEGSNLGRLPSPVDVLLRTLSRLEWDLIESGAEVPFGSGVICVARA